MIKFKKSSMKYKDENGNMQDAGQLFGASQTDTTLTKSGVGADAKVVGDKFNNLSKEIADLPNNETLIDNVAEIVKAEVPLVKVAEQPDFVDSIAEMTDTSKAYVLKEADGNNGYIYRYREAENYNLFKISEVSYQMRLQDDVEGMVASNTSNAVTGWIPVQAGKYYALSIYDVDRGERTLSGYPATNPKATWFKRMNAKKADGTIVVYGSNYPITTLELGSVVPILDVDIVAIQYHITFSKSTSVNISTAEKLEAFKPMIVEGDTADEAYQKGLNLEYIDGDTEAVKEWYNTGLAYNQPANYENKIFELEEGLNNITEACCDTEVISGGNYNLFKISEVAYSSRLQNDVEGIVSSTTANAVTGVIPVKGGKFYSLSVLHEGSRKAIIIGTTWIPRRIQVKLADNSIVYCNIASNDYSLIAQEGDTRAIQIPENAVSMQIHFSIANADISTAEKLEAFEPMIIEGDSLADAYNKAISYEYMSGDTEVPTKVKYTLKHDKTKADKPSASPYYREVNWGCVPTDYFRGRVDSYSAEGFTNNTQYADYIAKFKALMTGHEAYVTETALGTASDGQTIYAYNFKPVRWDNELIDIPKIIIVAGQHGTEKCNTFGIYYFVKDLLNNWFGSPALEYLRHHMELIIVPVVNTYGFDNFQYKNANGVNINRNYSSNWTLVEDTTSPQYGGAEPFDQPESQLIRDLILNNKDASLVIDSHTNSSTNTASWGELGYYGINNISDAYFNRIRNALPELVSKISPNFNVDYNLNAPNTRFGFLSVGGGNGIFRTWVCDNNISGVLIEGFGGFLEGTPVSADVFKANEEQMVNWLITVANYLSK